MYVRKNQKKIYVTYTADGQWVSNLRSQRPAHLEPPHLPERFLASDKRRKCISCRSEIAFPLHIPRETITVTYGELQRQMLDAGNSSFDFLIGIVLGFSTLVYGSVVLYSNWASPLAAFQEEIQHRKRCSIAQREFENFDASVETEGGGFFWGASGRVGGSIHFQEGSSVTGRLSAIRTAHTSANIGEAKKRRAFAD
ncbi:hypothetical protein ACJJTC_010354 [Scirpophaga incertulas]